MGVLATDLVIKTGLDAALNHLRKHEFLLDDVFGDIASDKLSRTEYGWKEVERAKTWFKKNNIPVVFPYRGDSPVFPCISVVWSSTHEQIEFTSLSDDSNEDDNFDPKKNAVLPQYVYLPFTPQAYNPTTGSITFPSDLTTVSLVPGMFLVSAVSGNAYQILQVTSGSSFNIAANTVDDFSGGYIVPPTNLWHCQRERTRLSQSFSLGLHAASDPAECIWMRQLIQYILLRYKEAYFDFRGFELSTFSVSEIDLNPNFKHTDKIFSCFVSLSGNQECQWIKFVAPRLWKTEAQIVIANGPATPAGYVAQAKAQGWEMQGDISPSTQDSYDEENLIEGGIEVPDSELGDLDNIQNFSDTGNAEDAQDPEDTQDGVDPFYTEDI